MIFTFKNLIFILLLVFTALVLFKIDKNNLSLEVKKIAALKLSDVVGTRSRLEAEYKLVVTLPENYTIDNLVTLTEKILKQLVESKSLKLSSNFKANYQLINAEKSTLFRDIYFDTKNRDLEKNGSSYRLRHRWSSLLSYENFLKNQSATKFWPTRCEVQSKINRSFLSAGLSQVDEARFEMRKESAPFSSFHKPPEKPWFIADLKKMILTGYYRDSIITPAFDISSVLAQKALNHVYLEPVSMILNERWRFHYDFNMGLGTGPNPSQIFIITIDQFIQLPLNRNYLFIDDYSFQFKKSWPRKIEIEIEYERNFQNALLETPSLERAEKNKGLEVIKMDHALIKNEILNKLHQAGFKVEEAQSSKFLESIKHSE